MKIKVSEATPSQLDWLVAKCEGIAVAYHDDGITCCIMKSDGRNGYAGRYNPSTDWSRGSPLIEREEIDVIRCNDLYFPKGNEKGDHYEQYWKSGIRQTGLPPGVKGSYTTYGPTPLISAMRCYVASKLGSEAEVPESIIES